MPEPPTSSKPKEAAPREMRFIVRSAGEAVERVRESLGPNARVVSVRQVKGAGLQRFLAAPRLEVVARAGEPPPPPPEAPPEPTPVAAPEPESSSASGPDPGSDGMPSLTCRRFLERAGLPGSLLARLEAGEEWRRIGGLPLQEGLPRAVRCLRDTLTRHSRKGLTGSAAFVGGAGSGKTTALCKLLAREVFIEGRQPRVLRLEVDKPHLDDGLLMYCEVLGIACARSLEEVDFQSGETIYVDVPGYSLREIDEQRRIADTLDRIGLEDRILVLNAAYEEAVLHRFLETGDRLGARFQILTHLDEIESVGKLWEYLFDAHRSLLFFSDGQNIAGDRIDDPFGYLLDRTFPR